jgi:peptidoglycan/LPS O-acetylase OafA/YrhL
VTDPAIEASGRRSVLPTLTGLRWWAALAVFGYHLSTSTGWVPARPFSFGQAGVAFFFVLSGFVLTWAFRPGTLARDFYRRRCARVFPSYFVVLLIVVAITVVWPNSPFRQNLPGLIGSLSLTQAWMVRPEWIYSYNAPGWSLSAETFFYLLFPVLLVGMLKLSSRRRVWVASMIAVAGLVVTVVLALIGLGGSVAFPNPLVRLPQFALGIAAALFVIDYKPRSRSLWLPLGVLAVSLPAATIAPLFPLQDYILLPAALVLIIVSASRDLAGQRSWVGSRALVYLGEISFCFYLVHDPILRILTEVVWHEFEWDPAAGIIPALTALFASIAAAIAVHHVIELPAQRLLSRKSRARVF